MHMFSFFFLSLLLSHVVVRSTQCFEHVNSHEEALEVLQQLNVKWDISSKYDYTTQESRSKIGKLLDESEEPFTPGITRMSSSYVYGISAVLSAFDQMDDVQQLLSAAYFLEQRQEFINTCKGCWMYVEAVFSQDCQVKGFDVYLSDDRDLLAGKLPENYYLAGYLNSVGHEYMIVARVGDLSANIDSHTQVEIAPDGSQSIGNTALISYVSYRNKEIFDQIEIKCGKCQKNLFECSDKAKTRCTRPSTCNTKTRVVIEAKVDPGATNVVLNSVYEPLFPANEFARMPAEYQGVGSGIKEMVYHGMHFSNIGVLFADKTLLGMDLLENINWSWDKDSKMFKVD